MGKPTKKIKFYAVKKGKKPGIYNTWEKCKEQVLKVPGAIYKSFDKLSEAQKFINMNTCDTCEDDQTQKSEAYAYIDGSFDKNKKIYGYGGYIMYKGEKYVIQGNGNDKELVEMRNVAGEILASQEIIKKAIELGIKSIDIFYDYAGIENWATGIWACNKTGTKDYHDFFQDIKSKIKINFKKVKGHSGNEGNDEADKLAKEACFKKNIYVNN